jgi:hypothetical protein
VFRPRAHTTGANVRAPLPDAARPGIVVLMPHRTAALLIALLLPVAVAAGCGESAADKAQDDVCAARDDIGKQVDELKGLTLTSATTSQVTDSLRSIRDDLSKIADAQGELSDDRRQEVQAANEQFRTALRDTAASVGKSLSVESAADQVKQSLEQLAASYKSSFARIDCS